MKHSFGSVGFVIAVWMTALTVEAQAGVVELDEARVLVEINAFDGDAGFHVFFDGDPWTVMKLKCPDDSVAMKIKTRGKVRDQGMTEGFFESSEPNFEEQSLEEFLERFPEGTYVFRGRTKENELITGAAELTHNLPAAAVIVVEQDDEEIEPESEIDPNEDLEIEWKPVTTVFAEGDPQGEMTAPLESKVVRYIVVVEVDDDEIDKVMTFDVLPEEIDEEGEFCVEIDDDFLLPGLDYKVEIGVREESGNQTFWEFPFSTAEEEKF